MKNTKPLKQKTTQTQQAPLLLPQQHLAPIFATLAHNLCQRLLDTKYTFTTGLDLSAGLGHVRQALPEGKVPPFFIEADFYPHPLPLAPSTKRLVFDVSAPFPFAPKTFDLVLSNMLLPHVHNAPHFLAQAGRILKEDGLFVASTLGMGSFWQLTEAIRSLPPSLQEAGPSFAWPDVQSVGQALQSVGFALPVVDRQPLTLTYKTPEALCADLSAFNALGLFTPPSPTRPSPQPFQQFSAPFLNSLSQHYFSLFKQKHGYAPLSLEIIYLHGWRPHNSQQKPLERGSATVQFEGYL